MSPERWRQVEELYHAAIETEADRRAAFLTEACAGDAELRQEVESLMEHAGRGNRLDRPAWDGAQVGPYQILEKLGAGGMGDVWKARDTRLGRLVAIKRSKARFSERFEREARAVAALNHPHICTLYDVGPDYLVMEHVEGKPLRGPLPLATALGYATQIAEALEAAHREGIIHRDLKPSNVLVNKAGVKLLDFGLARRVTVAPAADAGDTPTELATAEGVIVGTLPYMSPEQVQGGSVDQRTDIFAFGCTLYEMLTGKRPFEGNTTASVIAAILNSDPPPVSKLQPVTPAAVDRVVKTCLAKDPNDRWQTARDLRHALLVAGDTAPPAAAGRRQARIWAALPLAVLATWVVTSRWFREPATEPATARFILARPQGTVPGAALPLAVSPDGRSVAFVERDVPGKSYIWVRRLDSALVRRLDATESAGSGADNLASRFLWSPDSQFIAFSVGSKLKRVSASGGTAQLICEPCIVNGAMWNRDRLLLTGPSGIRQVPATGGTPTPIAEAGAVPFGGAPHLLPDAKHFLAWTAVDTGAGTGVFLQDIGSRHARLLAQTTGKAEFAPPGSLLFVREGALFAQRMDMHSLTLKGEPRPVAEEVAEPYGFSAASNGVLAFRSVHDQNLHRLFWYDRAGKRTPAGGDSGYASIRLSPDQKRAGLARVDSSHPNGEVWLLEMGTGILSRVAIDPAVRIGTPVAWSPDSRRIFVTLMANDKYELRQIEVASGASDILISGRPQIWAKDWSRDNRYWMYHESLGGTTLYLLPVAGDRKPQTVSKPAGADGFRFSPDSNWVTYASNDTGKYEVYVAPLAAPSETRQVSVGGGVQPTWRRDGRELYYLTTDGKLMAVNLKLGSRLEAEAPKLLFQTNALAFYSRTVYDATADGNRFLFVEPETRDAGDIHVLLNWEAGLRGSLSGAR